MGASDATGLGFLLPLVVLLPLALAGWPASVQDLAIADNGISAESYKYASAHEKDYASMRRYLMRCGWSASAPILFLRSFS